MNKNGNNAVKFTERGHIELRASTEGADIIRSRIKQYDIKCDYKPGGIFAALNKKQLKGLAEQKSGWERYGNHNLRLLDAAEIAREVGTKNYVGGLLDMQGGHVHPLNLALGEAAAILSLGGKIYEQSAAVEITYGEPIVVRTAKGVVRAKYLLIAGNAYLPQGLDNRVTAKSMPCGSQIVVTEPLTEQQARSLQQSASSMEEINGTTQQTTQLARNLAAAFAFDETKTATLIDCDALRPAQHGALGVDAVNGGLMDYLDDRISEIAPVQYRTVLPRMYLVPTGGVREITGESFSSLRMRSLVDSLRSTHGNRYLVLDGPPVLQSPDARILSDLADLVVLVAGYGRVTTEQIEKAAANFEPEKLAGVVFNDIQ